MTGPFVAWESDTRAEAVLAARTLGDNDRRLEKKQRHELENRPPEGDA